MRISFVASERLETVYRDAGSPEDSASSDDERQVSLESLHRSAAD